MSLVFTNDFRLCPADARENTPGDWHNFFSTVPQEHILPNLEPRLIEPDVSAVSHDQAKTNRPTERSQGTTWVYPNST